MRLILLCLDFGFLDVRDWLLMDGPGDAHV